MVNSLISERGPGEENDAERSAKKINDRQRGDRGDQDPQQHPDRLRNHLNDQQRNEKPENERNKPADRFRNRHLSTTLLSSRAQ